MAADAPRIDVSKFSRAVTVIQPLCGDVKLPPATGFFWRYGYGHLFLVTNWHVLSGRDVETGQPRLSHGGCPDRIQINAHVFRQNLVSDMVQFTVPLVQGEEVYWWEHPTRGQAVDVAVLPLAGDQRFKVVAALTDTTEALDMAIYVGQEVFIIGYPLDAKITGQLPIWKRGTIASEPNYPVSGEPKLLVDSLSRPGMSGSPVIARTMTPYMTTRGEFKIYSAEAHRNIGVYSGRLGADQKEQAQLGVVWDMRLVQQICGGKKPGKGKLGD